MGDSSIAGDRLRLPQTVAPGEPFADCWFLTGPTASGKSEIGLRIAERCDAEIVSLDSMTLYKRLDIGTAKPSAEDRRRVPHHMIDVLEPWEPATLDWYLKQADGVCDGIRVRGKKPLFVGGTPLYLKACLRGIFVGPPADLEFRKRLEAQAAEQGSKELHDRLATVDPVAASRIAPADLRRIVRALEVFHHVGRPISELQRQFDRPGSRPPAVVCLTRPREELRDRIDRRVVQMLRAGWVDEVRELRLQGVRLGREASQAAGYKEILQFLDGEIDERFMIERIQARTRQLSKRQMTWFRHIAECRLLETSEAESPDKLADRVLESLLGSRQ